MRHCPRTRSPASGARPEQARTPAGRPTASGKLIGARAARQLTRRAVRARERRFLVEGAQGVREGLVEPGALLTVFVTAGAAERHADLLALAAEVGVAVQEVDERTAKALSETLTPQGIVGVAAYRDVPLAAVAAARPRLVAVLVAVRDPGNAGTVLRTADAAGADAAVLTDASVDVYNGKCVRATAGSIFHLPVVVGVPAAQAVGALRGAGLTALAADAAGSLDLDAADEAGMLARPTAWLFGNEARGLPEELGALADAAVRVPIFGRAESLNLASAAAVCLYASRRAQRRGSTDSGEVR